MKSSSTSFALIFSVLVLSTFLVVAFSGFGLLASVCELSAGGMTAVGTAAAGVMVSVCLGASVSGAGV